jgi:hypothetical protein
MPDAPKLACCRTPLGGLAIKSRVTKGAAKAAAPMVLRNERRLKEQRDVLVVKSTGIVV